MKIMKRRHVATLRAISAALVCLMAIALSLPPLRSLIEQSMVWHMVIQMPLLVLGGWLSMQALGKRRAAQWLAPWNRYGLTGFIAAQAIIAYWMLPLAIDRAVVVLQDDVLKLLTLWVSGAMLQHSVARSPAVLQLFFVGYTIPMMIWLGFYFTTTDLRLCNAYSLASQVNAGRGLVVLGFLLGLAWLVRAIREVSVLKRTASGALK